jgi:hypothetical protein
MKLFQTPVEIAPCAWNTGYDKKHVFIGSCFTENIGAKMKDLKFNTEINPFGILFNPFSISQCLRRLISGREFCIADLFIHNGLWHSFSHHGRFSGVSPEASLQKINTHFRAGKAFLYNADFLFLTFGTAWVFEFRATGQIVSNCHKVPASEFKRFRLMVNDIVSELRETLELLWEINPGVKVIFTVSPVRHLKDSAVENQLSKAALLLAADALIRGFGEERCRYFPAYELVMDELRDYRFYAEDMVHPSSVAIDFIWEKFSNWIISKESRELSERISALLQTKNHLPIYPDSPEFFLFVKNSYEKTLEMAKKNPFLDFSAEIEYFANKIAPHELR